jgi:hypothetical protein
MNPAFHGLPMTHLGFENREHGIARKVRPFFKGFARFWLCHDESGRLCEFHETQLDPLPQPLTEKSVQAI